MGKGAEHFAEVESLRSADRGAASRLIEVLGDEGACWHKQTAAIASLERLQVAEAGPAILKLLAKANDPDVVESAIAALGTLRVERARRLLERFAEGSDLRRATLAKEALEKLAG